MRGIEWTFAPAVRCREREVIMRVIGKRNQKRREHLEELRGAIISNSSALAIMPGLFDGVAPDVLLDFRMELCSQTGVQSLLGLPAWFID